MPNDKKIEFDYSSPDLVIHRIVSRTPELHRNYGFWIINASVGCSSPAGGFRQCRERKFEFYSLSHLYDGGGEFWQPGGRERPLHPGEAVLIAPGDLHRYGGSDSKPYIEDSIRFTGPLADLLHRTGIIRTGVYELGPLRRIPALAELIADPSSPAQIKANILLQQLLTDLYFEHRRREESSPIGEVITLIKAQPEKWWTVAELAELCNLSMDQFRRNFLRHTGMLPKRYLEELKLRQSAELLFSTRETVAEIAGRCGYVDPYHFSRRFKRLFGVSPERYRRDSNLFRLR